MIQTLLILFNFKGILYPGIPLATDIVGSEESIFSN